MMSRGSRLRQIGWLFALSISFGCFIALTFQVNSVKSEVRLAERQIVQLEREKLLLETEFQARANQQQLADWNAIEFGYKAPRADQYISGVRQLASLGVPRGMNAPSPIRVARAPDAAPSPEALDAMVSPISGQRVAQADRVQSPSAKKPGQMEMKASAADDFARAFGEATPLVARVAEVVE